ncbi:Uncharacterised protein [Mycobacteroides abscessus subsp. abscessus]|nr:Uncharacterised protein [Mycobacteroides abscessus subsp. abscessus]
MRKGSVLIALRSVTFGFSASPAVTPTSSTPTYANTTICRLNSAWLKPVGNTPPSFHRFATEGPVSGPKPEIGSSTPMPMMIMPRIAVTLIIENQNSASPKIFTDIRLAPNRISRTTSAVTHCGMPGHHRWIYTPATVISAIHVVAHTAQ